MAEPSISDSPLYSGDLRRGPKDQVFDIRINTGLTITSKDQVSFFIMSLEDSDPYRK